MTFFEEEMARLTRMVKRIEENPDPKRLKSNKLYYELGLDLMRSGLEAIREGKPSAEYVPMMMTLFYSMGFQRRSTGGDSALRMSTSVIGGQKLFEAIRRFGLPDDACDSAAAGVAVYLEGLIPHPDFVITHPNCESASQALTALAQWYNIPHYHLEPGLEITNDTLNYVTDQLGEIIELAERTVPGIKYDEDRMVEMQELNKIAFQYQRELYQLRKRTPCPISGRDAFRPPRLPHEYPDPHKFLEYLRIYRDEMYERADKGMSAVAEEKLRVMWTVTGPVYVDPFSFLEKRGVSTPMFYSGPWARFFGVKYGTTGDEKEFGRKLSPLEEEARMANLSYSWAGLGTRWLEDAIDVCRDLKIDAIIDFRQMGCSQTLGLGLLLEERAQKELGIATLHLEGRNISTDLFNEAEFYGRLGTFIDFCLARKGTAA